MLKKRIATVAVAGIAALGVGHAVLAATDITGSNHVEDSDTTTGDANSNNSAAVVNGQFGGPNTQDGDNEAELGQSASAQSGDGVNGQVIGAVDGSGSGSGPGGNGGGTSVNASNSCEDCDAETGESNANNNAAVVNGQFGGPNTQEGDNETEVDQDADSSSGDANNGQVIGVVQN